MQHPLADTGPLASWMLLLPVSWKPALISAHPPRHFKQQICKELRMRQLLCRKIAKVKVRGQASKNFLSNGYHNRDMAPQELRIEDLLHYHNIRNTGVSVGWEKCYHCDWSLPKRHYIECWEGCRLWWNPNWNVYILEQRSYFLNHVQSGGYPERFSC